MVVPEPPQLVILGCLGVLGCHRAFLWPSIQPSRNLSASAEKTVPEWLNVCGGTAAADVSLLLIEVTSFGQGYRGIAMPGGLEFLRRLCRFSQDDDYNPQNQKILASLQPEHSIHKLHTVP